MQSSSGKRKKFKMKVNQFYMDSSIERTFKYSKQDVNNAVTWKQELNKKRN